MARSHPQHGLHVASDAGISPHQTQRRRGAVASCRKVRAQWPPPAPNSSPSSAKTRRAGTFQLPTSLAHLSIARQKSIHFQALRGTPTPPRHERSPRRPRNELAPSHQPSPSTDRKLTAIKAAWPAPQPGRQPHSRTKPALTAQPNKSTLSSFCKSGPWKMRRLFANSRPASARTSRYRSRKYPVNGAARGEPRSLLLAADQGIFAAGMGE